MAFADRLSTVCRTASGAAAQLEKPRTHTIYDGGAALSLSALPVGALSQRPRMPQTAHLYGLTAVVVQVALNEMV